MQPGPVSLAAYVRLLRSNRNFRLLWMAQIVSELGDWFYAIALYSLLLELTASAKTIAVAYVLQVLPEVFVAPAAGVLNDRVSRKRIMIASDVARAVIVLGMLAVRSPGWVWLAYLLLLLETVGWGFFEPGRTAVVPVITGEAELLAANALSSVTWSFNLAVGAGLGGFFAAFLGRDAAFAVNAASFLVSAALIRAMRFSEAHVSRSQAWRWRDLADFSPFLEGARYMRRDPRLLATLLVKGGLGLLGSTWVLLPLMGERIFPVGGSTQSPARAGMLGMSVLMSSRGVGALLGPLVASYCLGREPGRLRAGILLGFLASAAGYLGLAVAPTLVWACAAVVLAHAGGSVVWVFSTTLLQQQTEDRFRGRVFSTDYALFSLTVSAVSYLAGLAIDLGLGLRTLAGLTGLASLVPGALWLAAQRLWREPRPLAQS